MSIPRLVSTFGLAVSCALGFGVASLDAADKLVYADFELPLDQRPVSSRGGLIQMLFFQENAQHPVQFKGMEGQNPPAPMVKMTAKDGSNKAIAFEYELPVPNQWAGVGVEVHGLPDKDGKPQSDDVSGFKSLSMQIYTPDVAAMRVEFISKGLGINVMMPPSFSFHTRQGFNTYKVKLTEAMQPGWVTDRINPKDVLRKLTAVNILAVCDDCREQKGVVVLDNLVFEP